MRVYIGTDDRSMPANLSERRFHRLNATGPPAMLVGQGPWVHNEGGRRSTVQVNVNFTGHVGRGYVGIYTGSFGNCIVVSLLYGRVAPNETITCTRGSLAHLFGGNYYDMTREVMLHNMSDTSQIHAVVATNNDGGDEFELSATDQGVAERLQEWGVRDANILFYINPGGFGIDRYGNFGNLQDSTRPYGVPESGFVTVKRKFIFSYTKRIYIPILRCDSDRIID